MYPRRLIKFPPCTEGILQAGFETLRWLEIGADNEGFDATCATAPWLCDCDMLEQDLHLGIEEVDVLSTEDLGNEFAAWLEHTKGKVECRP